MLPVGGPRLQGELSFDTAFAAQAPEMLQKWLASTAGHLHLRWVLHHLGVNVVLDVGANVGQYAAQLRGGGYTGRIVSFEPLPELATRLREAAAADPEWQVKEHALGDRSGTQTIHARPGTMSSLLPSSTFGRQWRRRLGESEEIPIQVRRLDEVLDEACAGIDQPRVFVKLDTQGYDLPAFQGAGDRVGEILGLQSEISCLPIYDGMPGMVEQLQAYLAAGLTVSGLFPVSFHATSARMIEFDVVMVRQQPPAAA
ncbi:FkbM family methyltransferase [Nocardioides limicola]|uniref:FkbM family methyltransferase n=1 Tax=Nocardioides limicola TaxID=2803368 RepID=UPI00193BA1D2|nr:FkbM family methyltransferase [Nocardioides sp. DJM-14]